MNLHKAQAAVALEHPIFLHESRRLLCETVEGSLSRQNSIGLIRLVGYARFVAEAVIVIEYSTFFDSLLELIFSVDLHGNSKVAVNVFDPGVAAGDAEASYQVTGR